MAKPLARYRDDKDLDEMLREQERDDDPMLRFLMKKKSNQDKKSGKKGGSYSILFDGLACNTDQYFTGSKCIFVQQIVCVTNK